MVLLGEVIRADYDPEHDRTTLTIYHDSSKEELIKTMNKDKSAYRGYYIYDLGGGQFKFAPKGDRIYPSTILAVIHSEALTTNFKILVIAKYEHFVEEYSFVKITHENKDYIGYINKLVRNDRDRVEGNVVILGVPPRIPFRMNESVKSATEEEITKVLGFQEDGYYLGRLYPSNATVKLKRINSNGGSQSNLFNGINVYGNTGAGKTVFGRVLSEELSQDCCVLWIDALGDCAFVLPNQDGADLQEKIKRFGVIPSPVKNLYVSMSKKYDPFAQAELKNHRIFKSEELFTQLLLAKGQITTISLKGLDLETRSKAAANIVNTLLELGLTNRLPAPTVVVVDEVHELAKEGMEQSQSKDALKLLATRKGHANIIPVVLTQRKANVSKGVVAPSSNMIVFKSSEEDIQKLGYGIKSSFGHMVANLPRGTCLITGLFDSTLPVEIRPSKTRHFRNPDDIPKAAAEHPELCKIDQNLQDHIDQLVEEIPEEEEEEPRKKGRHRGGY